MIFHIRTVRKLLSEVHCDIKVIKFIKTKSLEWSKSSKLSVKQSAFKNFSRAVKLPDFRLKIKNKCQHYVASFGTEVITPS